MDSLVLMMASYGMCFGLMHDKVAWLTNPLRALPLLEREEGGETSTLFMRQFACAYCTGFHTGAVTWMLQAVGEGFPTTGILANLVSLAVWAWASSTTCYVIDVAVQRLDSHVPTA